MKTLKNTALLALTALALFHLCVGVWKEGADLFVDQQKDVSETIRSVSGLFVLNNAVVDPEQDVGLSHYSIETYEQEIYRKDDVAKIVQHKRSVVLVPLFDANSPTQPPTVQAWVMRNARDTSEVESLKQSLRQGTLWSPEEIVETTESRLKRQPSFEFVSIRWLRRVLRHFANPKQERKRISSMVSAASLARSRYCTEHSERDVVCSPRAPLLFHGRRYRTFLGLGFSMWITLILTLFAAGFAVGRNK